MPDGALMGNGHMTAVVGGAADYQRMYISTGDFWEDVPRTIGQLNVSIPALSASGTTFDQTQDVGNAEVRSTFANSNVSISQKAWVSADEDLLVFTVSSAATSSVAVPVTVQTYAGSSSPRPTTAGLTASNTMWVTRSSNGGTWLANAAMATRFLNAVSPTYSTDASKSSSGTFTLGPGQSVTVVTSLAESACRVSGTPWPAPATIATELAAAQNRASQLNLTSGSPQSVTDAGAIHSSHLAWWQNFWLSGATIDLGGGIVERYWYTSLYAMAIANRSGRPAPPMQNFETQDSALYSGKYYLNYNLEMPYQGLYAADHVDLTQPYERAVLDCLPDAKATASSLGSQGAFYGNFMYIGGMSCVHNALGQKGNAAWLALNFVEHWNYTHDAAWAQSTGYPYALEVANYWDNDLVKDANGVYNITNSAQNEGSTYKSNPIGDLSWLRYMYPALIEMSTALGVDSARRAKWQDIADHLAPYPTFLNGDHTDFKATQDAPGFYGGDANPANPVFPGNNIDLGSSANLISTAQHTINDLNVWCQSNSFAWIFPAAARVGIPETYDRLTSYLDGDCGNGGGRNNTTANQSGGGAETFGGMETVNSMLLTSANGIRVFPAWPATKNASFDNMVAEGAFSVSSSISSGVVGATTLLSNAGQQAVFGSPWAPGSISVTDITGGASTPVAFTTNNYNVVTFATTAGRSYRLTGTGASSYTALSLTRGAVGSASSSHLGGGWGPANALDGQTSSTSSSRGWSSGDTGTAVNHTESYTVDLGHVEPISRVDLFPRNDGANAGYGFPVDYNVTTSTDGTTWSAAVNRNGTPLTSAVQSVPLPIRSARFVKITGTNLRPNPLDGNQYRMQLAEMQVYAPQPQSLSATATASSSVESATWSVAALTGHTVGQGWSSSGSLTTNHTEWAQLDLGATKQVSKLDVLPRIEGQSIGVGYPIDFTIRVSTDGVNWSAPVVTVTGQPQPGQPLQYLFPSVASARYIRITATHLRQDPNAANNYVMQLSRLVAY